MTGRNNLDETIKAIFKQVFEAPPEEVSDQTRRGEFERWDSLGHLVLLEALREQFQIKIEPEQALEMETVGDIKRIVTALGADGIVG